MTIWYRDWQSPVGTLRLLADSDLFTGLHLPFRRRQGRLDPLAAPDPGWRQDAGLLPGAIAQLEAYFAGAKRDFDFSDFGLPVDLRGTAFQRAVWDGLCLIPHGRTCAYGDLARGIGHASAVRAVGAANGANPLPIFVPCHRVIAADGSLHGYGGGLDIKRRLLALEQTGSVDIPALVLGEGLAQGNLDL